MRWRTRVHGNAIVRFHRLSCVCFIDTTTMRRHVCGVCLRACARGVRAENIIICTHHQNTIRHTQCAIRIHFVRTCIARCTPTCNMCYVFENNFTLIKANRCVRIVCCLCVCACVLVCVLIWSDKVITEQTTRNRSDPHTHRHQT